MNKLTSYLELDVNHFEASKLMNTVSRQNPKLIQASKLGFSTKKIPPNIKAYHIVDDTVYLPRYLYYQLDNKNGIVDEQTENKILTFGKPITLRDYQIEPVDNLIKNLNKSGYGVLEALMGSGKTTVLLEVIRLMRQKTAVLVHTEFLMHQWVERVEQFLGFTPGIVQGDKCDMSQPITIFLIQSLLRRDYEDLDKFGLVAFDEFHRYSAEWFSQAIVKFLAKYRLGCSGTMERPDGLEWIGHAHLGPVNVYMKRSDEYKVEPVVYQQPVPSIHIEPKQYMLYGKPNNSKIITLLSENVKRNEWLTTNLKDALDKDRKIIVFSDRRKHLDELAELLLKKLDNLSYGFLIGGVKERERIEAENKQIIFCTWGYAAEGIDLPHLDVAFIATPRSNVQQAVGRIERMMPDKRQPIVFDPVDYGISLCEDMAKKRMNYYESRGWTVHT